MRLHRTRQHDTRMNRTPVSQKNSVPYNSTMHDGSKMLFVFRKSYCEDAIHVSVVDSFWVRG